MTEESADRLLDDFLVTDLMTQNDDVDDKTETSSRFGDSVKCFEGTSEVGSGGPKQRWP